MARAALLLALVTLLASGCSTPLAGSSTTPSATASPQQPTALAAVDTATATEPPKPTATPLATATPTVTQTPLPSHTPARPTFTATAIPPTATATSTRTPTAAPPIPSWTPSAPPAVSPPPPTPVPPTALPSPTPSIYRFLPAGPAYPDPGKGCPGCPRAPIYIAGRVTDAYGNPLAGVRLICYNDWYQYPVVLTKVGGEYEFAIIQAEATWFLEVLDASGTPISPQAAVQIDPAEACWIMQDWQRVD